MNTTILHQYPASPFSEKVRLAMGLTGTAWQAVTIPAVMPKPAYTPLTGGYRRTPAMQRGADIYCDSACILDELLPHSPALQQALVPFTDQGLFRAAVTLVVGHIGDDMDPVLLADRRALTGTAFDVARMRAAQPVVRQQLRAGLAVLDAALAGTGPWLSGAQAGLADLHAWLVPWFLQQHVPGELSALVAGLRHWPAWAAAMAALDHGPVQPLAAEEALAVARDAVPDTLPDIDPDDPLQLQAGQRVEVAADDWGRDPVHGELLVLTPRRVAVLRRDPAVGEVVVHFPRAGYVVQPEGATGRPAPATSAPPHRR